jgi:hypothetical protein
VSERQQTFKVETNWAREYKLYADNQLIAQNTTVTYASLTLTSVMASLPEGRSTLRLELTGGCPQTTVIAESIDLTYSSESATVRPLETNSRSPRLFGFVSDPAATILLYINTKVYTAKNNKNGTWVLPAGSISPDLADGSYAIRVVATNNNETISDTTLQDALRIDTTPPTASLTLGDTSDRSPELRGTIDDPFASIDIIINGRTYRAHNNGDGSWTLEAGAIDPLASGIYTVQILVKDVAGNSAQITQQLRVNADQEMAFLLAPNTGFLRLHSFNIPSWILYLVILGFVITIGSSILRKTQLKQPPMK